MSWITPEELSSKGWLRKPESFCLVTLPSQSPLLLALWIKKKEYGKAHSLLAAPDRSYTPPFSFIPPKALIQAPIWYDSKVSLWVPFPNYFLKSPRHAHMPISPLDLSVVNSATLIPQPLVSSLYVVTAWAEFQVPLGCSSSPQSWAHIHASPLDESFQQG